MRLSFPDELFYLKNKGDAEVVFDAAMFPRNQTNFNRNQTTLKVSGKPAAISGLTLRLKSKIHGTELVLKTDAQGLITDVAPQPLNALRNQTLLDEWTIRITVDDNPTLVQGGTLDLSGITTASTIKDANIYGEVGRRHRPRPAVRGRSLRRTGQQPDLRRTRQRQHRLGGQR